MHINRDPCNRRLDLHHPLHRIINRLVHKLVWMLWLCLLCAFYHFCIFFMLGPVRGFALFQVLNCRCSFIALEKIVGKSLPCGHHGDRVVVEMPITLMLRLKSGCGPYFKTHCATRIKLGLDVFGSIVWVLSINWWNFTCLPSAWGCKIKTHLGLVETWDDWVVFVYQLLCGHVGPLSALLWFCNE